MNRFKFENISILDDTKEDTFDILTNDISVEGFYPYDIMMRFWGKSINPQDYLLLSGAEGETLVRSFNSWVHSAGYFSSRGDAVHILSSIFKDLFFPYLTKDILSLSMSIPEKLKNIKDNRLSRDKLRTDLCSKLNVLDIPMQNSHYNFNFSSNTKKEMIDRYIKSQFYKDYKISICSDDLFMSHTSFSSKLWSFATTVYERIFV